MTIKKFVDGRKYTSQSTKPSAARYAGEGAWRLTARGRREDGFQTPRSLKWSVAYVMQTWASVEYGYWYARSAEFRQTDTMQVLRWLRVLGDTVFTFGMITNAAKEDLRGIGRSHASGGVLTSSGACSRAPVS